MPSARTDRVLSAAAVAVAEPGSGRGRGSVAREHRPEHGGENGCATHERARGGAPVRFDENARCLSGGFGEGGQALIMALPSLTLCRDTESRVVPMCRAKLIGLVCSALFISTAAWAAVPQTLHFSGQLDTGGTPLTGDVDVVFTLYTDPTPTGGDVWTDTGTLSATDTKLSESDVETYVTNGRRCGV